MEGLLLELQGTTVDSVAYSCNAMMEREKEGGQCQKRALCSITLAPLRVLW